MANEKIDTIEFLRRYWQIIGSITSLIICFAFLMFNVRANSCMIDRLDTVKAERLEVSANNEKILDLYKIKLDKSAFEAREVRYEDIIKRLDRMENKIDDLQIRK